MGASMRSRILGLAIIATLLLNVWGAEIAFARADNVPACCLRAAHPMHCHGMDSQPAVVDAHFHSGSSFIADRSLNCACPMGFAPANGAVPLPGNSSLGDSQSRALRLLAIRQIAATSSLIRIHGDRAPPTA